MTQTVESGKEFVFKDLIKYEKDKAVRKEVFSSKEGASVVVVAMDHAVLPDHHAPQDAILTVLEGEGEIVYEGVSHTLRHGISFSMANGALHSVSTDKKLKFMLLFY